MKISRTKIWGKFYLFWFSSFLIGVTAGVVYSCVIDQSGFSPKLYDLYLYVLKFFLPGTIIIALLDYLFSKYKKIQIYFYYNIWIKHIYGFLFSKVSRKPGFRHKLVKTIIDNFFDKDADLILKSFPAVQGQEKGLYSRFIKAMSMSNQALLIKREHLCEKQIWKNWAYSIALLFRADKRIRCNWKTDEKKYQLKIDLTDQKYGIYNSGGKLFLEKEFLTDSYKKDCKKTSEKLHHFLISDHLSDKEYKLKNNMVYRWASGGVAPIAEWKGQKWFVLLFRDISPIGWNFPIGASESASEYLYLDKLIMREFIEEIILLNGEPTPGDRLSLNQKKFKLPIDPDGSLKSLDRYLNEHRELRKFHDQLKINLSDNGPTLKLIDTPFSLKLIDYDKSSKSPKRTKLENIIFNLNPNEFGIEILRFLSFEMDDKDYLLGGELWEVDNALVRQPVMLLSCDYIKGLFNKDSSLGEHIFAKDSHDCKEINNIPPDAYKIFYKDNDFRKNRLKSSNIQDPASENEVIRIKQWIETYDAFFQDLRQGNKSITKVDHGPLTSFCPVTWKALEIFCKHDLGK